MITRAEIEMDIAMYNVCYALITEHSIDRIDPRYVRRAQKREKSRPYYKTNEEGAWIKSDNIVEIEL